MATGRLQTWKISVETKARGFHLRLKVSNALNKFWFTQKKSRFLQISVRANLNGCLLRVKVAASQVLGRLGDQRYKQRNVKSYGEFRFGKQFLRVKGFFADSKAKPKVGTTSYCRAKSCLASYSQSLKTVAFTQKNRTVSYNEENDYTWPQSCKAQLSSLMGNLSLLSYFVNKRERGASIVQAVGVLTTLVVLLQLAIAEAMPLPAFIATAIACLIGFTVNSLNYTNLITEDTWKIWTDILGVGGLYVLTQVVWCTFAPYLPRSKLPGIVSAVLLLVLIELGNCGQLPVALLNILEGISGWIATLLFMWSPVSQLYANIKNPDNLHGLSVFTILLAFIGNGMLIPRALFIRDLMWFTGSSWGCTVQGWAILLSMYLNKATNSPLFWGVTCGFVLWLGIIAFKDMRAYSLTNPVAPFVEIVKGKRKYEVFK